MATITNGGFSVLTGGQVMYPKIAVGSYNAISFLNCTPNTTRTIACGGNSISVTIGTDGKADVSLMPFIRNDMKARNVQEIPLTRSWRGELTVTISNADDPETIATTLTIWYIYGFFRATKTMPADVWRTYNTADGDYNVVGVDFADHYNNDGTPISLGSFQAINADPSTWVVPPTEGSTFALGVHHVSGNRIFADDMNYHFTLDCRTENVVMLRWVDENGYQTCRKFARGTEKMGASVSNAYNIPHTGHLLVNNNVYDYGRDEWASIAPQRTLTIGEDSIPANQYEWIKSLITSPAVEMLDDEGVWVRVNLSSPSVERDTRKAVFLLSVTLTLWSDDIQQF